MTERADQGDQTARAQLDEMAGMPPVLLNIAKQRSGDWEGKCGLWFSSETYQYRSSQDDRHGTKYVPSTGPREDAA